MLKSDIFQRTHTNSSLVSGGTYNLVIGLVLCWGFGVNWLMVTRLDPAILNGVSPWMFFIGYLVSCFLGTFMFNSSSNPLISFIGYNFVVVPFGFMINMAVSSYNPTLVLQAIQITAAVTVIMMILGTLFPSFFQAIYSTLFIALIGVILVQLFLTMVMRTHSTWLEWGIVIIFCGYIGYDWGRANRIPKTVDNAIDSAAALYMDIINLFLKILSLLARRR